jgi:predicted DsbA family dithiol-disulfide isomerase|tara:strand:+ start:308 stop:814 length:507 start_codon:yes stop_codon:yes gene_type:complete
MVHFPLHPETPIEGQTLEELFAGRDYDIKGSFERMKALMEVEGLPYGQRSHTYNSRLAQELGTWAGTQDGGDALHMKIYQAYFVDNKNVGDIEVLVELAESAGLDGAAARKVMEDRSFEEAVDADWNKARQVGVTGVPTYVAGGAGVVGAQPYEALEQLMEHAGAEKR